MKKTNIKKLRAVLITVITAASFGSGAQTTSSLETTHDRYIRTAREIRVLYSRLGVGEVVAQARSLLVERIEEQMVEKYRSQQNTRDSESETFILRSDRTGSRSASERDSYSERVLTPGGESTYSSAFFGGNSHSRGSRLAIEDRQWDSYSRQENHEWDVTRFIVKNPQEIADFDQKIKTNENKVRQMLRQFILANEQTIIHMKELGVLNMAAAYELLKNEKKVSAAELASTAQLLGELNFLGAHIVTTCIQVQTIDRLDKTEIDATGAHRRLSRIEKVKGVDFNSRNKASSTENKARRYGRITERKRSGEEQRQLQQEENDELYRSNAGRHSYQERSYWRQVGQTEKHCRSTLTNLQVGTDESVFSVNLSQLDGMIADWLRAIDLLTVTQTRAPLYPTFGSPYYESKDKK